MTKRKVLPSLFWNVLLLILLTACVNQVGEAGQAGAPAPTAAAVAETAANTAQPAAPTALVSPIPGGVCTTTAPTGDPLVVGGSLSLTGVLAPTANIHRVVGEVVVQWLNECGGLLGRPVTWQVLDDQSAADQAAANYERLTTVDKVDFVMGPYAAAAILAGAGPVGRAGYIYPTHTNGAPQQAIGDFHFPAWQIGDGSADVATIFRPAATALWDALASTGKPPSTIFYASAKFPTTLSLTQAFRTLAEEKGVTTVDAVEYDLGTTDFSAIALRISAAAPDFVYVGGIGLDAVNFYDAFAAVGYTPRGLFVALPSPGPVQKLGDQANGLLVLSIYENHPPFTDNPIAAEFTRRFQAAAAADGLLDLVETQAAASLGAWQILLTAVAKTNSTDHQALKAWLLANEVETIVGALAFDGFNGYGADLSRIVQIQEGQRVVVWPPEWSAATIIYPNP